MTRNLSGQSDTVQVPTGEARAVSQKHALPEADQKNLDALARARRRQR